MFFYLLLYFMILAVLGQFYVFRTSLNFPSFSIFSAKNVAFPKFLKSGFSNNNVFILTDFISLIFVVTR